MTSFLAHRANGFPRAALVLGITVGGPLVLSNASEPRDTGHVTKFTKFKKWVSVANSHLGFCYFTPNTNGDAQIMRVGPGRNPEH